MSFGIDEIEMLIKPPLFHFYICYYLQSMPQTYPVKKITIDNNHFLDGYIINEMLENFKYKLNIFI